MYTLDFESQAIEPWPHYPPKSAGIAVKHNDEPAIYLAWDHPTENNCSHAEAKAILEDIRASGEPLLFQNARFDMAILCAEFDWDWNDALRIHDTMYLLFLYDPLAPSLSLKPSAERLLGLPPEEQDAVHQWLVANGVVASNVKEWGAHIAKAPGKLVGKYAGGDVDRTKALYDLLLPQIIEKGMEEAYDRERFLAPILNQAEAEGIYIDYDRLQADYKLYEHEFKRATVEAKTILGQQENGEFNIDSGVQLANAIRLSDNGVADDDWPKTPTGKFSTSRETLERVVTNPELQAILTYRGILKTLLGTFMNSWLTKAVKVKDGYIIHPSWNQVRGEHFGTRTGRLSSSNPNFQNIPTDFDDVPVPQGYLPYPHMRQYILPDPGEVLVSADFHSQEIRMLGHFAEGAIQQIYTDDPSADIHQVAADLISDEVGLQLKRKHTKIVAFSILYGAGNTTMATRMGVEIYQAANIKKHYLRILTGVKEFMTEVEDRARAKQPVRSWGGRLLHAPAPVVQADGRIWNKDYVLLNYLIQGSSADQTKQAVVDYAKYRKHGRFLCTVHDEICTSVPMKHLREEIELLHYVMEKGDFCLPMRATIEYGPNWFNMEEDNE